MFTYFCFFHLLTIIYYHSCPYFMFSLFFLSQHLQYIYWIIVLLYQISLKIVFSNKFMPLPFMIIPLPVMFIPLDGQTGSGKTHTMVGIQNFISEDLFVLLNSDESYINTQVSEWAERVSVGVRVGVGVCFCVGVREWLWEWSESVFVCGEEVATLYCLDCFYH